MFEHLCFCLHNRKHELVIGVQKVSLPVKHGLVAVALNFVIYEELNQQVVLLCHYWINGNSSSKA